jgi:predicted nucleotide-binding protein (sugar kinase/HSP70/actin superfamily)
MGNLYITARALLEGLGLEVVVPPPCTKRTLTLGTQHSPEFACLPLKLNLGNYIEAAERGAEVIVMAGGVGPCRFGYYAQVQREILRDLGYHLEMVVLEPPDVHFSELVEKIKYLCRTDWRRAIGGARLAWWKTRAVDEVEKRVQWVRAREKVPGTADRIYDKARAAIDRAESKYAIKRAAQEALAELDAVERDEVREAEVVKIALVGEIYTLLEPFMNMDIEKKLGRMGAEVRRNLYLSEWINDHLFAGLMRIDSPAKKTKKLARQYLGYFVGGHGRESVGSVVYFAREGFDGLIQLAPFTCMPEIVAEAILPKASQDYGLPVMTIFLDEQTGEAGLVTRLEAFVDMVRRRKRTRGQRRRPS